ncbi:unnamed protein product [Mytilus edulis]|uniref:Uncharacterized protein n=1 Tax=Mytilus edulis TaxID=6550 RepID=A0A8S3TLU6_MYTED|nr:unnamed protein product [Mytilus edulis]
MPVVPKKWTDMRVWLRETTTTSKEESRISINYTSIRTKHPITSKSYADTLNNRHKGHVTSAQIVSRRGSKTTIMNTATSTTMELLAKKPSYIVLILVLTIVAVAIISSGVLLAICRASSLVYVNVNNAIAVQLCDDLCCPGVESDSVYNGSIGKLRFLVNTENCRIPNVDPFDKSEDWPGAGTFHYSLKGFKRQPTDYDDRPFHVANEKGSKWMTDTCFHAFHARQAAKYSKAPLDISSLLPMFQKEAKSIVMIRHSVNIAKQCVQFLNPGQRPVITCDQPLYALANSVQWNWPNRFSEEQIVVLFGGLHIEKAALRTIGDWLENSGWTSALSQANIAPLGTADSCLRASNVSRTRHVHEVTTSVQYSLMQRSYWLCMEARNPEVDIDFNFD